MFPYGAGALYKFNNPNNSIGILNNRDVLLYTLKDSFIGLWVIKTEHKSAICFKSKWPFDQQGAKYFQVSS
jgi:hypothetical protein